MWVIIFITRVTGCCSSEHDSWRGIYFKDTETGAPPHYCECLGCNSYLFNLELEVLPDSDEES
jgi:hypothetical protein